MDVERLSEDVSHSLARVERGEGVLKDDRHVAPHSPHCARPHAQDVSALEAHLAGGVAVGAGVDLRARR